MRKELFRSKRWLLVLFGLMGMGALVLMPLGCGGSSSGTGSGTVSLSGTVADPTAGDLPGPVGDATVGAYRFDDSTLISSTTSAASGATGSFTLTDIPTNVEIYLKAGKTGYVTGNTRTGTLTADDTGADVMILSDTSPELIHIANELASQDESSWNSTLQDYGYLVMDAEDNILDEDLAGLTVTGAQQLGYALSLNAYYNSNLPDGSGIFITAPPTVMRASTNELPMMGASMYDTAGFGPWTMTGSTNPAYVALDETTIDAPIIQGEITYFIWEGHALD